MKHTIILAVLSALLSGCASSSIQTPSGHYEPRPRLAPASRVGDLLTLLEGCVIVADDGQPLGVITQNEFASNSLLNEYGKYGNKYSSTSIFNEYGTYGGEYSRLSPFNEFTTPAF
jgi:hypothetical protein